MRNLAKGSIHPIHEHFSRRDLGFDVRWKGQLFADRAHASNWMQRKRNGRGAWIALVRWSGRATELSNVLVAR
eukprot:6104294-Prymnesium_polylepis.1